MKRILKHILDKLGVRVVKASYYNKLVNINTIPALDFHYLVKKLIDKNDTVCCFDIGANIGQTAKKIRGYFPNSKIYCFEPMTKTFDELSENLKGYNDIELYKSAIGSREEDIEVFYQANSEWNTLVKEQNEIIKKENETSDLVKVNTLDSFVLEHGIIKINFLKSDTEGFELEVLKGAHKCLTDKLIDMLYVEVGFSRQDRQHNYWIDVIQYLEKYNYEFSGLFELSYGHNLKIHYANALFVGR